MAYRILSRYLDTNGNGTGTTDAIGDYSGAEEIFYIQPPSGSVFHVARMIIMIRDAGSTDAAGYGSVATPLTNGIEVREAYSGGTITDLTAGVPVKRNAEWGALCYDAEVKTWGTGDEILLIRWTFERAGIMLSLNGSNEERLEVVLNDDFSGTGQGLNEHRFLVQGFVGGQTI